MAYARILLGAVLSLTAVVKAQDFSAFPAACSTACAGYVKNSFQCQQQFPVTASNSNAFQACFCEVISTADTASCATCLTQNNASGPAALVTQAPATCTSFQNKCVWQCGFTTCAANDINCQCAPAYLQNIFDCASCNTANKNTGSTQLADYTSLAQSCEKQNLIVSASAPSTTDPAPSPTSAAYTAPTLTGNGVVNSSSAGASAAAAKPTTMSGGAVVTPPAGAGTTAAGAAAGSAAGAASAAGASGTGVAAPSKSISAGSKSAIGGGAVAMFFLSLLAI